MQMIKAGVATPYVQTRFPFVGVIVLHYNASTSELGKQIGNHCRYKMGLTFRSQDTVFRLWGDKCRNSNGVPIFIRQTAAIAHLS